ncbi:MAG: NUDIX domain-containing protein [Rhodospirillaceae bacterium]|nr:NUDIX domain-containing protein [Rhodospirillaceae bacterium]
MSNRFEKQQAIGGGAVQIELSAALVAIAEEAPQIMLVREPAVTASQPLLGLPCGPFDPVGHRTLEEGLRRWVHEQTGLPLGYVEQLYTFGDRYRDPRERAGGPRPVSVGYLALVRESADRAVPDADWSDWYRYFPWEDWRGGEPALVSAVIVPALNAWADRAQRADRNRRRDRVETCFGRAGAAWDNERVLERYELLYEAGLVIEARVDSGIEIDPAAAKVHIRTGTALIKDHRRIMATAMGRLRAKVKYRPVIFELMPPSFTLFQLQRAVEALAGTRLHKQNFRRLVAHEGLVEATGQISGQTGGRPAELFRFRRDVVRERPAPGVRLPAIRMSGPGRAARRPARPTRWG